MNKTKFSFALLTAATLVLGFQNCGNTKMNPSQPNEEKKVSERVTPLTKEITQILIAKEPRDAYFEGEVAELHPDGRMTDLQTGREIDLEENLKAEISKALNGASLCAYDVVLPEGSSTCAAIGLPHALAKTSQGEQIQLIKGVCGQNTIDLCKKNSADFKSLVQRIQTAIHR